MCPINIKSIPSSSIDRKTAIKEFLAAFEFSKTQKLHPQNKNIEVITLVTVKILNSSA